MKPIRLLAIIFLTAGCGNNSPVPDFTSWEGTWLNSDSDFSESWIKITDSKWQGTGKWFSGDSAVYQEEIMLINSDSKWFYNVHAPGQNDDKIVQFTLLAYSDSSWTFTNPEHDFPNKIVYQLLSSRMMKVNVSGIEKGKPRSLNYSLIKKP